MSGKFFLDRSPRGEIVPRLLRENGWELVTMHEHYGKASVQTVADSVWIHQLTAQGFVLLTDDYDIVKNPLERAALIDTEAAMFVLLTPEITELEKATRLLAHQ